MTDDDRRLSTQDILAIPEADLPLLVFSRNMYSTLGSKIASHGGLPNAQRSPWNHFFLVITPGQAASQDWVFKERPIDGYLRGEHILKFWTCNRWDPGDKEEFIQVIREQSRKPLLLLGYDWLQIIGYALKLKRIGLPWFKICTDWARFVRILDRDFDRSTRGRWPFTPAELNLVFAQLGYQVYGRFYPEF